MAAPPEAGNDVARAAGGRGPRIVAREDGAAAMPMRVAIVSPDGEVFSGEADMVVARTTEGEIGVMPGHVPLLGVLVPGGSVRVKTGGTEITASVDGGFLSVTKEGVSILAEAADLA